MLHVRLAVVQRVRADVEVARHHHVLARRRKRLRPVLHRLQQQVGKLYAWDAGLYTSQGQSKAHAAMLQIQHLTPQTSSICAMQCISLEGVANADLPLILLKTGDVHLEEAELVLHTLLVAVVRNVRPVLCTDVCQSDAQSGTGNCSG